MGIQDEIDAYLRSRVTLVCVASYEEEQVVAQVQRLCERTGRTLLLWDHADFFQRLSGPDGPLPQAKDPLTALEAVEKLDGAVTVLLRDFHQCW